VPPAFAGGALGSTPDMPQNASIECEVYRHNTAVVMLVGEHDLATAPELARVLADASERRDLLVDLSHCTFLDSSIMGALLRVATRLSGRGSLFALVIAPGTHVVVRNLFSLMDLEKFLPIYDTRAAAIEYLETAQPSLNAPITRLSALSDLIEGGFVEGDERGRAA
jgi:anti-anti-sigma factor